MTQGPRRSAAFPANSIDADESHTNVAKYWKPKVGGKGVCLEFLGWSLVAGWSDGAS